MYSIRSDFFLNGARDYIHGPTLAEKFRETVVKMHGKGLAEVRVRRLNIRQKIINDDTIRVFDAEQVAAKHQGANALADMFCEIDGKNYLVGLYADQPKLVVKRRESIEQTFVGEIHLSGPFEGNAELQNILSHYDLIQGVVEVNKQLHLKTVADVEPQRLVKFKFVSCRGFVFPKTISLSDGQMKVENIGMGDLEGYRHTLSKISLDFDSTIYDFTIGFASQDTQDLNFA
ncbi:MAG: hypothetical protein HQ503_19000 [Rhodospirillales bacterium]|nr:hypothetical protein [Rhodospirillales bacterium]